MKIDPNSLEPGAPTMDTPDGVVPLADGAYFAQIATADGVGSPAPIAPGSVYDPQILSTSWPASSAGVLTLSAHDAAIIAVVRLVQSIRWHSYDLAKVLAGEQAVAATIHRMERVFLDWPEWSEGDMPAGVALVTSDGEATWDSDVQAPYFIEGTANRFAPDSMLRHEGEWSVPLRVICWCAHKDQRRGLHAAMASALAAERVQDLFARRVIVPEYFGLGVRVQLVGMSRPDSEETAQGNRWPLDVRVTVDTPQVTLVRHPGRVAAGGADVSIA